MDELTILNKQLQRMRSMNKLYHLQFLKDVRFYIFMLTVLVVMSFYLPKTFYLIPHIALFGSVMLAFHAYYLIFSRHYTEYLEKKINFAFKKDILITHKLENSYFFPIIDKKIVVAKIGKNFSWFSFVTLFITTYGFLIYSYGMFNILDKLYDTTYFAVTLFITIVTLIFGYWWFVNNIGETRLMEEYDNRI